MRSAIFILIGFQAIAPFVALHSSAATVADLQGQMAEPDKVTVIDVRSPLAYGQEHIPGAINIPAALCPLKNLPPLGTVVIYGGGVGKDTDAVAKAAAALSKKPGLKVDILEGGYAAWQTAHGLTTRRPGLQRASFNYISYADLKTARDDSLVLVDMRKPPRAGEAPLTDLTSEFAGLKRANSLAEAEVSHSSAPPLLVLIDSGDGTAEATARRLKAAGTRRYVILAGGEMILSRHGQAGLQRNAPSAPVKATKMYPVGAPK
jgi:rhodanese-related sulfurtransferase